MLKLQYSFGSLVLISSLVFIYLTTDRKISLKAFFFIILCSIFGFFIVFMDGLVLEELTITPEGYNVVFGPFYNFYGIFLILVYVFIIYKLSKGVIKSKGLQRDQIKYILIGAIIFGTCSVGINFILPFFKITSFGPYDAQSSIFFIGFSAYAITRYRFMDIKIFIRRSMVVSGVIITIIILALFSRRILRQFLDSYFVDFIILFVALMFYAPLKNYFYKLANKHLFASLYNKHLIIKEINDELLKAYSYNNVGQVIFFNLERIFHINELAIVYLDKKTKKLSVFYNKGFVFDNQYLKNVKLDKLSIKSDQGKTIEVEEYNNLTPLNLKVKSITDLFQGLKPSIITLLEDNGKTQGYLFLGQKSSGDIFYEDDIYVLDKISRSIFFALNNIKRNQEKDQEIDRMRKFIQKLK